MEPEFSDKDFEQFALMQHLQSVGQQIPVIGPNIRQNYCPECEQPMQTVNGRFTCADCGHNAQFEPARDFDDIRNTGIRIATGHNKNRFYNQCAQYDRVQLKNVMELIKYNAREFESSGRAPFSQDVLLAAVTQYNFIQRHVKEEVFDDDGNATAEKKFVRRSSMMSEIIATLIWFETIRSGNPRSKNDIADFMRLNCSGFSRGEDCVRDIAAMGHIELPDESAFDWGYVDRYLESLNIDSTYRNFIVDLVAESERVKLGMTLQFASKIAGAIWTLNVKKGLGIKAVVFEQNCDGTKKNTFCKFHKLVIENPRTFKFIFDKYMIPW